MCGSAVVLEAVPAVLDAAGSYGSFASAVVSLLKVLYSPALS